jgi:hypothetical protein
MADKTICKNCNSKISDRYCSSCGQRTTIDKVTFKETFQDLIDVVFSINSPLFLTIKLLLINPGKLFREYLSGKRKTYYKPVSFFILTTIVFVLLRAFLNYDPMKDIAVVGSHKLNQSLINSAGIFMAKNINNVIFTFVFSLAIFLKLFFYKKYSFVEYLAISFYVIGFYVILTSVLMFGLQYAGRQYKILPFILLFFYIIYVLISLFQRKNLLLILKIIFIYVLSVIFYMIFGYGISFLIVWIKTL